MDPKTAMLFKPCLAKSRVRSDRRTVSMASKFRTPQISKIRVLILHRYPADLHIHTAWQTFHRVGFAGWG